MPTTVEWALQYTGPAPLNKPSPRVSCVNGPWVYQPLTPCNAIHAGQAAIGTAASPHAHLVFASRSCPACKTRTSLPTRSDPPRSSYHDPVGGTDAFSVLCRPRPPFRACLLTCSRAAARHCTLLQGGHYSPEASYGQRVRRDPYRKSRRNAKISQQTKSRHRSREPILPQSPRQ